MLWLLILAVLTLAGDIIDDQSIRLRQSCQSQTTGYFWNGQQCLKCKKPACICSSYLGCTACVNGYYYDLETNDCKPCPTGCQNCCKIPLLTEYICTLCDSGYRNINGVCVYMGKCASITMHGRCIECDLGYYVDFQFVCQPCDTGCRDCSNLVYCNECKQGYQLINANSTLVCEQCKVQGCKTCHSGVCTDCLFGYRLENNACIQCLTNCDICTTSKKCQTCNIDTVPNADKTKCLTCGEEFKNCLKCTAHTNTKGDSYFTCNSCLNGYYFDPDGQCQYCREKDTNTRRCESLEIITQCYPGYLLLQERYYNATTETPYLLKYSCIKNQYSCATLKDSTSQCATCLTPQILYSNSTITQCIGCADIVTNCSDCYLTPQNKFKCIQCSTSYYLSSDGVSCKKCGDNCLMCKDGNTCVTCTDGFIVINGVCLSCLLDNCKTCSAVGVCTNCQDGYGSINGLCKQCQHGCKSCNYNQQICLECSDGYYLYMKSCVPVTEHCLEVNEDGFCYLCETITDYDETRDQFVDEGTNVTYTVQLPSVFYKSVNGYCLKCSDYDTGQFFCPDTCLQTIASNVALLGALSIIVLLF